MESKKRMAALENEKKKEDTRMSQWIDAVFGGAFIAYTHLKALSAFVEAFVEWIDDSPGLKLARNLLNPACPRVS